MSPASKARMLEELAMEVREQGRLAAQCAKARPLAAECAFTLAQLASQQALAILTETNQAA